MPFTPYPVQKTLQPLGTIHPSSNPFRSDKILPNLYKQRKIDTSGPSSGPSSPVENIATQQTTSKEEPHLFPVHAQNPISSFLHNLTNTPSPGILPVS